MAGKSNGETLHHEGIGTVRVEDLRSAGVVRSHELRDAGQQQLKLFRLGGDRREKTLLQHARASGVGEQEQGRHRRLRRVLRDLQFEQLEKEARIAHRQRQAHGQEGLRPVHQPQAKPQFRRGERAPLEAGADLVDEAPEYEEKGLEQVDGVLVPGGFGSRGWEGKLLACRVAREQQIPYLGICLGMHVAVSEYSRHVLGLDGANSTEMDPETPHPVIDLLPEQKEIEDLGGTMRLGAQAVEVVEDTKAHDAYGEPVVHERHRHRYEVNNHYRPALVDAGLVVSGTFQAGRLVEIVELPDHPWFVASQFHPEFKSRPTRPAPLFREFVAAALVRARARSGVEVA